MKQFMYFKNKKRKFRDFLNIKNLVKILLPLCVLFSMYGALFSQSITLVDVLPPYKFTAGILQNGHFFITTKYIGDTTKQLIYIGAKDPVLPPNYTSHLHFKIDNVIYQMPFEDNPKVQMPPPEFPLVIEQLYRDTLGGKPRINAKMSAIDKISRDTIRFIFSMMPIKKPSGGFIRMSVFLENSPKTHSIGSLMEIDTKIGDNDKAPIITSFGYYDKEKEFTSTTQPPIPEFWLALEGTPANPMLTARGNLKAPDLLTPDYFMFGNWKDYSKSNIKGLNSFMWKDRPAQDTLPYDDSAVLLIWDERNYTPNMKLLIASTEIGIVDSFKVVDAGTTSGGGGSGGGMGDGIIYATAGDCIAYDTLMQKDCLDMSYHPYTPDSLSFLFIMTNTKTKTYNNVRLVVGNLPPGVFTNNASNIIIPSNLTPGSSSVGVITFYAEPRLLDATFNIPVYMMDSKNDTLAFDKICIIIPGIQARDSLLNINFGKVCPINADTLETTLFLKGVRCRSIDTIFISGIAPDINCFSLVPPIPKIAPANGTVPVRIRFKPVGLGNFSVNLTARILDYDNFIGGDTVHPEYTSKIIGEGKDEEFFLATSKDTLNFGPVCLGDTGVREWPILNRGGCDVTINTYRFLNNLFNQFALKNGTSFPLIVPKNDVGSIGKGVLAFIPKKGGWDTAQFVIEGPSIPFRDTLTIIGFGDVPNYILLDNSVNFDTICPGQLYPTRVRLRNTSTCIMDIDSVWISSTSPGFSIDPAQVSILPNSEMSLNIKAQLNQIKTHQAKIFIKSKQGIDSTILVTAVVADRILMPDSIKIFGNVRLGLSDTVDIVAKSSGTADVVINNIFIAGVHPNDYKVLLPNGVNYPIFVPASTDLLFKIVFKPLDIEERKANIVFDLAAGKICNIPLSTILTGRGYRPIIDIPQNSLNVGKVCVGSSVNTTVKVRNLGNGMLIVNNFNSTGNYFKLSANFPFNIDTNKNVIIPVTFTPTALGDFQTDIYFRSDGDWLFPDTLLHLYGTGIICGTISVDSVVGIVGSMVDIPVRIRPDTGLSVSSQEYANIMNNSGQNGISFSIAHKSNILRFQNQISAGMMQGSDIINVFPDSVVLKTVTNPSLKTNTDIIAKLSADVLLGNDFQSPLELKLNDFAGKYSRINLESGNILVQSCALDKRFIQNKNALLVTYDENKDVINLKCLTPGESEVKTKIYNSLGLLINESSFNGAGGILNSYDIPMNQLSQGVYFISVQVNNESYYDKVLIVR